MTKDTNIRTLDQWEEFLAPQVRQVELLGEITLNAEATDQLGRRLAIMFDVRRRYGNWAGVLRALRQQYPCAFASFLVALGAHDNNSLDGYWPEVQKRLETNLTAPNRSDLGQLFEQILKKHQLPLFPDMGGYRYVSLILVHGGIPNYSFNDYFDRMLRPAVTKTWFADLAPDELIEEWLSRANTVFIDKPVLRFLEYGGTIARDFVGRTRELAFEFLETGLLPSAEQVGLPRRVVQAFYQWAVEDKGFEAHEISRRGKTGLRLHRPEIRLDPWGEGISIDLPPQQIPASLSQTRLEWNIKLDGRDETRLPLRLERVGYSLQTPFETIVLEDAVGKIDVSLVVDNETRRTWHYDLSSPLLVFDPERHTLLNWKTSLPTKALWLLYPHQAQLTFKGAADKFEEFPRLPWGWNKFKGEVWDISRASSVILKQGSAVTEFPIREDDAVRRPHFVDGQQHRTFTLIKTPLYLGPPPVVRIPLVGRVPPEEELARWRISLFNDWPAAPDQDMRRVPLTELRERLTVTDQYVDLPLDHPGLLGSTPIGNYTIRLRGPLGRDAELPLRIMPLLELTGHEPLYLPDPRHGPPEIGLLVETQAGIRLEAQTEQTPCQVNLLDQQPQQWTYKVTVPPDLTEARLVAVNEFSDDKEVRVPLRVPLRRVRWASTGDTANVDSQRLVWTGRVINQSLDVLEQTVAPVLFVDLGPAAEMEQEQRATLALHLVDQDGRALQEHRLDRPLKDPDSVVWRFELAAFLDTLRQNTSPAIRFELIYYNGPDTVRLPVLNVSRVMQVAESHIKTSKSDDTATTVNIRWHEKVRLRNRRVRIWPVWQPWQPCLEKVIPDDATGEVEFMVDAPNLLSGKYLLEFLVVDPWATSAPATIHPPTTGSNLATLAVTRAEVRMEQLEQNIRQFGPRFDAFLEHAYIQIDRQQPQAALSDLRQCYDWFDQATIPQILSLARLTEELDEEKNLLGLVRMKMSNADRVRELIELYGTGQLTLTHLYDYRDQILHQTGLWSKESCDALLRFPYEPVQIFALMHLIKRGLIEGGETILRRVKDHRFSDVDGVDLFEINLDFAAEFLAARLDDPSARRLLLRVTERDPDRQWPILLVQRGHFVHNCAGWARIDRIEMMADGQQVEQFLSTDQGYRLHVTLRPAHDKFPVTLEILPKVQRVHFEADLKINRCTRTPACAFATPDVDLLYNGHNRSAHDGLRAQFELKNSPLRSVKPVEYRLRAPINILE